MKSNKTLLLALSLPLVSTVSLNGSMLNGGLSDKAAVNTATDTSEKAILNAIMINPTTADILFSDNTRLSIDFYGENIFRFFKDNSGGIIRKPEAKPDADILVDSPREKVSGVTLTENDEEIAVSTSKVRVSFDKRTSLFKLIRLSDNYVVAEAASPLEFTKKNVSVSNGKAMIQKHSSLRINQRYDILRFQFRRREVISVRDVKYMCSVYLVRKVISRAI